MTNRLIQALMFSALALMAWTLSRKQNTISWKLNNTSLVGGYKPFMLGNPQIKVEGADTAVFFNGIDDGLVFPVIPLETWKQFTIEVKFKPDADGPVAPRFVHFEDTSLNRGTIELRLRPDRQWYLDAFLKNGKTNKGNALIDSTKLHPCGKWYWVAMAYDGKKMFSYVNGKKELEAEMDFPVVTSGQLSVGVRLNKVNWFKGLVGEIQFHPYVLVPGDLHRIN